MSAEKITCPSCRHSGNNRNEQDQVSFRCGRCGYTWQRENMNSDDKLYKRGHDDGVASAKEEIDRLARLCEAKDAEIANYRMVATDNKDWFDALKPEYDLKCKRLSEAQSQIAMQADMFERIAALVLSNTSSKMLKIIDSALSATSETVAAWRAKETEQAENRGAMKALEELKLRVDSSGLTIVGTLDTMLAELRAANKGEVK